MASINQLQKTVRNRQKSHKKTTGHGIGFCSDYIRTIDSCSKNTKFWKLTSAVKKKTEDEIKKIIQQSNSKFSYCDESMKLLNTYKKSDSKYQLTKGSICDFDCVLTTARKDRDKDVLEPAGADIDQRMPLLWQHIPVEPIGKLVKVISQDEKRILCRFAIAPIPLGRDAVTLLEFGSLRISHGFQPIEMTPNESGNSGSSDSEDPGFDGWHITKYHVMEGSLVSVPANPDAGIIAWERGKFHHPLTKQYFGNLYANRKKFVNSGFEKGKKEMAQVNKKASEKKPAKGKKRPEADDNQGGKDKENTKKSAVKLKELAAHFGKLSRSKDLPREAATRLNTLASILEEASNKMQSKLEEIQDHANEGNISQMMDAMGEIRGIISDRVKSACDELSRVLSLEGIPEGHMKSLTEYQKSLVSIAESIDADAENKSDGNDSLENEFDEDDSEESDQGSSVDEDSEVEESESSEHREDDDESDEKGDGNVDPLDGVDEVDEDEVDDNDQNEDYDPNAPRASNGKDADQNVVQEHEEKEDMDDYSDDDDEDGSKSYKSYEDEEDMASAKDVEDADEMNDYPHKPTNKDDDDYEDEKDMDGSEHDSVIDEDDTNTKDVEDADEMNDKPKKEIDENAILGAVGTNKKSDIDAKGYSKMATACVKGIVIGLEFGKRVDVKFLEAAKDSITKAIAMEKAKAMAESLV